MRAMTWLASFLCVASHTGQTAWSSQLVRSRMATCVTPTTSHSATADTHTQWSAPTGH